MTELERLELVLYRIHDKIQAHHCHPTQLMRLFIDELRKENLDRSKANADPEKLSA